MWGGCYCNLVFYQYVFFCDRLVTCLFKESLAILVISTSNNASLLSCSSSLVLLLIVCKIFVFLRKDNTGTAEQFLD